MDFLDFHKIEIQPPIMKKLRWLKVLLFCALVLLSASGLFFGGVFAYQKIYKNKAYPGTRLGQYDLGGMTQDQIKNLIDGYGNKILADGLDFSFAREDEKIKFKMNIGPIGENAVVPIYLNAEKTALKAILAGKTDGFRENTRQPFDFLLRKNDLDVEVFVSDTLIEDLKDYLVSFDSDSSDARLSVKSVSPLEYEVIPEKAGQVFDYERAKSDIARKLSLLSDASVEIFQKDFMPAVVFSDVAEAAKKLDKIFSYGNLTLTYVDPQTKVRRDWNISPDIFKDWLKVKKNANESLLSLDEQKTVQYLDDNLREYIDKEVRDAKFEVVDGKVRQFQASHSGVALDAENTFHDLNAAFMERNYQSDKVSKAVAVSAKAVEPKVKVSTLNDYGIQDVLGTGVSSYAGSHTYRVKNIANAVERLNGILIKPDEVFSTNFYAGPYILENGYFKEAVIKGDKIEYEVGGGMCQIGTTLFRMAMNAGMPIVERRNHSLVVSYYFDPVNRNPGTDATVYEPLVDFKFLNDTGHYLLLQTEMDPSTLDLRFTLWGTSDGRSGSYTHPIVEKWIKPDEPRENKTTDLPPGERECQNAFTGALTSFTYTRFTSTSEKIDRVFESYYRPLPQICMVGATKEEICAEEGNCKIEMAENGE